MSEAKAATRGDKTRHDMTSLGSAITYSKSTMKAGWVTFVQAKDEIDGVYLHFAVALVDTELQVGIGAVAQGVDESYS
jgi:hypothetical protein